MLDQGYSKKEIATCIGKNRSSIYREINRNKDKRSRNYRNDRASGMLKMKKIISKEAVVPTKAINELLEEWLIYIL